MEVCVLPLVVFTKVKFGASSKHDGLLVENNARVKESSAAHEPQSIVALCYVLLVSVNPFSL